MSTDEVKVYFADGSTGTPGDLFQRKGQRITVHRSGQAHKWKLIALREKTDGTQNTDLRLMTAKGLPASGVQTAYTYPTLESPSSALPATPATLDKWSPRCCVDKGRTDASGHAQYTWGANSWIDPYGNGPYGEFIVDPERGSDCVMGLGWYPGTNHHGVVDTDWVEVLGAEDDDDDTGGDNDGGDYSAQLTRIEGKLASIQAKLDQHFK